MSNSFLLCETTIGQINDMTYYSVGVCLYQCRFDLLGQILSICVLALSLLLLLLRPVLLEPGLQVATVPAKRPSNLMVLSLLLTIARIAATLWRTSYRNDATPGISSQFAPKWQSGGCFCWVLHDTLHIFS